MPQPSSTRQVSSTGLSRRCCLRASPDRPTRLRLAVPKWTRRQGEETPLGPSSGEETPISQDGMSYRVRSLPSSLFHPSNRALPSDCVARVEKVMPGSSCDCSSPGLQVGWLGRKPAACLFLEFLSLFLGTCALVSPLKTDLSQCSGSSCGRAQGSSFFPCLLFAGLRSEVSFSPWQSHHISKRQPWHPPTVWFSLGTTEEEWSASS